MIVQTSWQSYQRRNNYMKRIQVNHITGGDAVDWVKSGKELFFLDGFGMKSIIYDDVTHMFYFKNFEDQLIGTNWNEARIANMTFEVER